MTSNGTASVRVVEEKEDTTGIDTDRVSRVLPIMGSENLKKLLAARVAIVGMSGGLGSEIAKNLILCGPGTVIIADEGNITVDDLAAGFYFDVNDVGKPRVASSLAKFQKLNPYCTVRGESGPLSDDFFRSLSAVVLCNVADRAYASRVLDLCHASGVVAISADVRGFFLRVFCDFGDAHVVRDATGEELRASIVSSLAPTPQGRTLVTIDDSRPHGLSVGDYVLFSEVKGDMARVLVAPSPFRVSAVQSLHCFEVDAPTTNLSYLGGGLVQPVKVEQTVRFDAYSRSLRAPGEFLISDFAKLEHAAQLHVIFQALDACAQGAAPGVGAMDEAAARKFYDFCRDYNAGLRGQGAFAVEEVSEKLAVGLGMTARGVLAPMCAFAGGVVAQEVLKLTGKFMPIRQWFYFDSLESAPAPLAAAALDPLFPRGPAPGAGPTWAQELVIGSRTQRALASLRLFLVGTGALGCELLKNFALMGVGALPAGLITVTDLDNIEKSNLSRQFLFCDADIGKMKAPTACAAALAFRPGLRFRVETTAVSPQTESLFDDDFWARLDVIVNALDNVKARLYVDGRAIAFSKPLLESGTLGPKGNTQVIFPHLTESYGSSRDPPEASVPMCTLKNFPFEVEHTIEWARDKFFGFFALAFEDLVKVQGDARAYLADLERVDNVLVKKERLQAVVSMMTLASKFSFEECVHWARRRFDELFNHGIMQLLYNFPPDAVTREGLPFWSGQKRQPTPLTFDPSNAAHADFVAACAQLLYAALGETAAEAERDGNSMLEGRSFTEAAGVAARFDVPAFVPRSDLRIKEKDTSSVVEGASDDEEVVAQLSAHVAAFDVARHLSRRRLSPQVFEKDDDANGHVKFMHAASSCRALNYGIPVVSFEKTKQIAGRIIPAIATTTAMITGLVCLELYKVAALLACPRESWPREEVMIEMFRNSFINLALPSLVQAEPGKCPKNVSNAATRYVPDGFTLWDAIVIEGDLTFQGLIDYFKKNLGLELDSISIGSKFAYSTLFPKHRERLGVKVSAWTAENVAEAMASGSKYIPMVCLVSDLENEDLVVEIPEVVKLKWK